MKHLFVLLVTEDERADLLVVLRNALEEGIGYGHCLPGDPEYTVAEKARRVLIRKVQRAAVSR